MRSQTNALGNWLDALQSSGRYTFTREVAQREGPQVERTATWRAQRAGRLIQPVRGFFVIVPAEYRSVGAPPPAWFIDDLMRFEKLPYYVGLLSAASLDGASPQAVQEFQVVVPVSKSPIVAGRLRIRFVMRADIGAAATRDHQTPTGVMKVSTVEQTALDLVRYPNPAGGWDNLAAVLADLAPQLDPKALLRLAKKQKQVGPLQRLGYLLDLVHAEESARVLALEVEARAIHYRPFEPKAPTTDAARSQRWHLLLNRRIDID